MNLASLVRELNLGVRCCHDKLDREVEGGYVGDLLSDIIANSKKGDLWITRQSHQNIVAVASLREHAGIVLALGREPDEDTLEKATRESVPILVTDLPGFEIAGKIYEIITGQ
ncbi:MAG: DRTGG domain-containing protein [Syntrophales bacterium]|nr:DRTGG domain-containing protein [Syntrophales bacterium]